MTKTNSHLVIIPTYNEKENIEKMMDAVLSLQPAFDLLIVDDNSPDGTAELVEQAMPKYEGRLHLLKRPGKAGLGTAYIAGFKWGLETGYQTLLEMDCDFSHNPQDLPRLLGATQNGADVAIGSRYIKGGKVVNWPLDRVLLSKYASVYVKLITWMPVNDTTAGFVAYKRQVLENLDLDKIRFVGYAFQIEMKFAAWRLGFKLQEVPITFVDRVEGVSKMSTGIFKEAALGVWSMKWKSFFSSYRSN
jgi:dolichol-phosphate mannosyltransferase